MKKLACIAVCAASMTGWAASPSGYTIIDLGADQQPLGVNKYGVVVGYTISTNTPVENSNGQWTALQSNGGYGGQAKAINAKSLIVGYDDGQQVEWKNGRRKQLAGTGRGEPQAVANDGTIVGNHWGGSYDYCYKWKKGVYTELFGLGGGDCYANTIDPNGAYVGGQDFGDTAYRGFITGPGGTVDVGVLGGGEDSESMVKAVNILGHAAVWSNFDDSSEWGAAYWNGAGLVDIGLHPPGHGSQATSINSSDDVLVVGSDGSGRVLFLYAGRTATTTAIEPLIVNPDGWLFDYGTTNMAVALTDRGEIYGAAHLNGTVHAFRLVPAP